MFEKISECYSDKGFVYCNAWNENQQINDICTVKMELPVISSTM